MDEGDYGPSGLILGAGCQAGSCSTVAHVMNASCRAKSAVVTPMRCNPPARGLGLRPTLETGKMLVDAYLWVKIPGESDGQCNRWAPSGSADPVRGMTDPAAGLWFREQALELATLATPPL